MNRNQMKQLAFTLGFALLSQSSWAATPVKWTGIVQEREGFHSARHNADHELQFVKQSDNEAFDIVDSDALVKVHTEKDKRLLVEVTGELTDRFLFWGGNLIVQSFTVVEDLEPMIHGERERRSASRNSEFK